jgi:DNA-binding FadR family transcriptional regulator
MAKKLLLTNKQDELIQYLLDKSNHSSKDIPPINQISQDLGVSTASLREQLELLKLIGAINAKPRTGIQLLEYQFAPAVTKSLYYAVKLNPDYFSQFSEIRNHLEKSFFIEAAGLLDSRAIGHLRKCVQDAKHKLDGEPPRIPHDEHRKFHLLIYKPLNNIFLNGILEAYWDTYETVGLHEYTDLNYLQKVWKFHEQIIDEIHDHNLNDAFEILIKHMEMIYTR